MYKYVRGILGIAENVGKITELFMGEFGKDHNAIWLNGFTQDGKRFHLELTITKEATQDGT